MDKKSLWMHANPEYIIKWNRELSWISQCTTMTGMPNVYECKFPWTSKKQAFFKIKVCAWMKKRLIKS